MVFKKNDPTTQAIAKQGSEAAAKQIRIPIDDLPYFFENGGVKGAAELLERAYRGESLNESHKLFLKYFERYMPYFKPKLASVEQKLPPEMIELFKVYLPKREDKK